MLILDLYEHWYHKPNSLKKVLNRTSNEAYVLYYNDVNLFSIFVLPGFAYFSKWRKKPVGIEALPV